MELWQSMRRTIEGIREAQVALQRIMKICHSSQTAQIKI